MLVPDVLESREKSYKWGCLETYVLRELGQNPAIICFAAYLTTVSQKELCSPAQGASHQLIWNLLEGRVTEAEALFSMIGFVPTTLRL